MIGGKGRKNEGRGEGEKKRREKKRREKFLVGGPSPLKKYPVYGPATL